MLKPELRGLVLAGGQSQRMGQDKSQMIYPEMSALPQWQRLLFNLESCGLKSFLSSRVDQSFAIQNQHQFITDRSEFVGGPGVGMLSAHLQFPNAAWLVVACDFPWLGKSHIEELISSRQGRGVSVATQNADQIIEPLFAIWEPETLRLFLENFRKGFKSPQKILQLTESTVISFQDQKALTNINTVADVEAHVELRNRTTKKN